MLAAEVLRQEPPLAQLWLIYGSLGAAGMLACRWQPRLLYVALPVSLLMAIPLLMELCDPIVGAALRRESLAYYVGAHTALALAFVLPWLGALRGGRWRDLTNFRRRRRPRKRL